MGGFLPKTYFHFSGILNQIHKKCVHNKGGQPIDEKGRGTLENLHWVFMLYKFLTKYIPGSSAAWDAALKKHSPLSNWRLLSYTRTPFTVHFIPLRSKSSIQGTCMKAFIFLIDVLCRSIYSPRWGRGDNSVLGCIFCEIVCVDTKLSVVCIIKS